MRVIIQPTPELVGQWTARYIASKMSDHFRTSNEPYVLGLPTGSTPLTTYQELIKLYEKGKISFKNVITFNMDEYVGLPKEHPESYWTFMWDNFFNHIDIKPENANLLDGNADDLEFECMNYEQKISEAGGIDLFLGGIGSDGHIAFNEPFSSLSSRTRVKTLNMESVVANARFFGGKIGDVPRRALTVGVGTVMEAGEVVIQATGFQKAIAIRHVIEGGHSGKVTASALQLHPKGTVVCDDFATYELKVSSYKYFMECEEGKLDPMSIKI